MITTIKDELKRSIKTDGEKGSSCGCPGNLLSEKQKSQWPIEKGLTMAHLGDDHQNPMFLPEEDGFDGDTIFRKGFKAMVQHYTQDNENKRFPEPDGLIRFGLFFHLNLFQIMVLLLKNAWEKYFLENVWSVMWKKIPDNPRETNPDSLLSSLAGYESTLVSESYNIRFQKELSDDMFVEWATCLEQFGMLEKYQLDTHKLQLLATDMVNKYLFLRPTWSEPVTRFAGFRFKQLGVLSELELGLKEVFWIKKGSYQVLEMTIGDLLYQIEQLKIEHMQIENEWFNHFGQNHFYILELQLEESLLGERRNLELNPDLTKDQIEQLLEEKKAARIEEIKMLKEQMADQAWVGYVRNSEQNTLEGSDAEEYKSECKMLLRQIHKLTHPDHLLHRPFTQTQKAFLGELFMEAMTIKKRDPDYILGTIQISRLRRILKDVQSLYLTLEEEIDVDKELENASMKDLIDIYERRIRQLELDTTDFQNELLALQSNRDMAEKMWQIASPDAIAGFIQLQEARIVELNQKIKNLKNLQ